MSTAYGNSQSDKLLSALSIETFTQAGALTPTDGQRVIVRERGNASYITVATGYAALAGDITFANGYVGKLQIEGVVNALWFGATELTDSTVAIQACFTRAAVQSNALVGSDSRIIYSPVKVYIPAGAYLVSATLTQNANFVQIVGDGEGSTVLYRVDGTYGDTLQIQPVDPTVTRLIGSSIKGVKFDCRVEMDNDAHLRLESVSQAVFSDLFFENGFINIEMGGVQNCTFSNIFIESGRYFSTDKAGSKFVEIYESTFENTEVFFDAFNWTFTVNDTIEIGLEIQEGDGIWFNNGHILGADKELVINGSGSGQLIGMRFCDVWFDGFCSQNVNITGVAAGSFKNIDFNSCKFSGATSLALSVEASCNVADVNLNGTSIKNANGNGALLVGGGTYLFDGCDFDDIARAGASNQYFIKVETASGITGLTVTSGKMSASPIDYGIRVLDATCKTVISDVSFTGVAIEEVDILSSGFIGQVSGCITDRANFNQAATGTLVTLPVIAESVDITGTTATIDTIRNAWEGRSVVLVGLTAAHTLSHNTGNLLFNGDVNITLNANRGRRLTYSGTSWTDA